MALLHPLLDVLRFGLDLDLAVAHPGLVDRLGEDCRTVDDPAAAQLEARLVPGTDHGVAFAVALLKWSAEMPADARDGADRTPRGAAEQDLGPVGRDAAHAVLREVFFVENRHELVWAGVLHDVPVHT